MAEQKTREGREITRHQGGFTVPEGVAPPPLFSDQNFFLYNIAHERQIPTSAKPAIRLLGAFETEAEAREMVPENPTASYFVSPTHKFIPLLSSMDASLEATVAEISELHGQLIIANDKDFEDMIENQRQGVSGKSVRSIRKQSERTRITRELDTAHMKSCPQLTADRCVAGQTVAVITMLQDIRPASLRGEQPLEPLVAVLHVASTLEDASNYAKYTATKHYPRNVMFVVDMYKWLYPEHVDLDEIANVESSNEMVTEIAQKNRSKKSKIQEMKSQHPECVIEVDGKPREDVDALSLNPEPGQEMTRLP
jgi:hypothetical protein